MIENIERIGSFTSSQIYKLCAMPKSGDGFGKPGITYIQEKRIEKRMGRSISVDSYSRSMAWGLFMEMYVFSKLH